MEISGEREEAKILQNYSLKCLVSGLQTVSGDIQFQRRNGTKVLTLATLRQNGRECFVASPIDRYIPSCDSQTSSSSSNLLSFTLSIKNVSREDIGIWSCNIQYKKSNYFNLRVQSKLKTTTL